MSDRAPVFEAIRNLRGKGFTKSEVVKIDDLLDRIGIARAAAVEPVNAHRTNAEGVAIIKRFESLRLKAYLCPAGKWTIGWGHTGTDVHSGLVITEAKAEQLLRDDLVRFELAVAKLCPVATPNEFSALVSFAFNVGEANLETSTLRKMHNLGNERGAALQFARWNKARVNGRWKALSGLTSRRVAEAALYAKG